MSFSYYDKDNNIKKLDVKVGMSWSELKTDNEKINSIFGQIDDGDGIVQFTEKGLLEDFVQQIDNSGSEFENANNKILENSELESYNPNNAFLQSRIDKNYFSLENIKKEFPEDKFEFRYDTEKDDEQTTSGTIVDKSTGEEVLVFEYNKSTNFFFIDELTKKDKRYCVQYGSIEALSLHESDFEESAYEIIYENDQVSSYKNTEKSEFFSDNAIDAKILFNNKYSTPEWINNESIDYLSKLSTEELREFINIYHYLNPYTGILEEIKKSDKIDDNVKTEFLNNIIKKLEEGYGYNPELKIEKSQVKTEFYESSKTYSVTYDNNIINIEEITSDGEPAEKRQIDLNVLLENLPLDLHPKIKAEIQKLPGEVLMDMAIECSRFDKIPQHTETMLGAFSKKNDRISVGFINIESISASTIAHEVGHAIDHRRTNAVPQGQENPNPNNNQRNVTSDTNPDFIFEYELAKYKAMGLEEYLIIDEENKIFELDNTALTNAGYKENGEWTDKYFEAEETLTNSAYMFTTALEGPSELYCTAMLGESETTPKKYIPQRLMNEYLKSLAYTRSLAPEDRHIREF